MSCNDEEFPRYGIKLSYFLNFPQQYEGRNGFTFEKKTTEEVCEHLIKPLTDNHKTSYCEFLRIGDDALAVGPANIFVSHSWYYIFTEVVEALKEHFPHQGDEVFLWFDIFCVNQHQTLKYPRDWWLITFKNAIKEMNHTIMVLAPWMNPIPLTRSWCIWELYCTIVTNSLFEVATSLQQREAFVFQIKHSPTAIINLMLSTIKTRNCEARSKDDQDRIQSIIETEVGFDQMDSLIFQKMREWVIWALRQTIQEVQVITNQSESSKSNETEELYHLKLSLGTLLYDQGKKNESELIFKDCLSIASKLFGESDVLTLTCMNKLANIYSSQSKDYPRAVSLLQHCIQHSNSENLLIRSNYINTLAGLYQNQGNYEKAEGLLLSNYEAVRMEHGEEHHVTLILMNNLASLYKTVGKYHQAKDLFLECCNICIKKFGPDHPDTLMAAFTLAGIHESLQDYIKAKNFYEDCLKRRSIALGEAHPDVLHAMNNLATVLTNLENYVEAETLYLKVLEKNKLVFGDASLDTMRVLMNIGILYKKQGDIGKASQFINQQLIETCKELYGIEHNPDLTIFLSVFASLLKLEGKFEEAEPLYIDCINRMKSECNWLPNTPKPPTFKYPSPLLTCMTSLGSIYFQQNRFVEAESLFEESVPAYLSIYGDLNEDSLSCLNNLAVLKEQLQKFNEAENLYLESLRKRKEVYGNYHFDTLNSINGLAEFYRNCGRYEEAVPLFQECIDICEVLIPENRIAICDLIDLYTKMGKLQEAKELSDRYMVQEMEE